MSCGMRQDFESFKTSFVDYNLRENICNNYVIHKNAGLLYANLYRQRTVHSARHQIVAIQNLIQSIVALLIIIPLCSSRYGIALAMDDLPLPPFRPVPDVHNNDTPDECESCRLLAESFEKGMERTMRGKHEGGDTSWEEKNLKTYADSEVRLVEIQEDLCNDVSKGKPRCFSLAEEAETHIEVWWFEHRKNNVRLHDYLCINKLKKCCPEGAFGPKCQQCPSNCHNHGVCDGSGTRSGTGECNCQLGYTGATCEDCQKDYYKIQTLNAQSSEQSQFSCLSCHAACLDGCSGPSSANCTKCKDGYERDPKTNQCNDINECELNSDGFTVDANKLCPEGTYCLNTEGHYKCADCHRACSTCLGYGNDKCIACAPDYHMDDQHKCIFATDHTRYDPNIRDDESLLAYVGRRLQTDVTLKITLNLMLYPFVRWVVEKVNYGNTITRVVITFLTTVNLQMELYPYVYKMIILRPNVNDVDMAESGGVGTRSSLPPTTSGEL